MEISMELPSSWGSCVYLTPRTPARTARMIDDVQMTHLLLCLLCEGFV